MERRRALYLRDGISASAGFDSALALSDDRCDEPPDSLFVGVAVALLETCVWAVRGRCWSGVRGDEAMLDTSALRRVAWRSKTDGR